jgi:hypothetical protein
MISIIDAIDAMRAAAAARQWAIALDIRKQYAITVCVNCAQFLPASHRTAYCIGCGWSILPRISSADKTLIDTLFGFINDQR